MPNYVTLWLVWYLHKPVIHMPNVRWLYLNCTILSYVQDTFIIILVIIGHGLYLPGIIVVYNIS